MKSMIALLLLTSFSAFALETGQPVPDFTLKGTSGEVKLSDLKGKIVVLEWLNHGCPFVRKHYDTGNMQALQKKYTDQGVAWYSVVSSAKGKQGHVNQTEAKKEKAQNTSHATDILLDPTGKVGKMYDAKTTPHMYIINQKGILVYQGAIDDKPDTERDSVKSAKNYISDAMEEVLKGKKVTAHTTRAYGCSIKYQ